MTQEKYTILIIEDDYPIQRFLRSALIGAGYHVADAETGREGINLIVRQHPELLLLDLGLPDMDGIAVIKELREWSHIPIVVLSARGQEKDKVQALDAGADDYLTKPFSVDELLARIRVALRHSLRIATGEHKGDTVIHVKNLKIDFDAHRVFRDNTELHLTNIEYRLLSTMAKNVGKVLTHSFIIREVWGRMITDESHPLRVYMAALRKKIEPEPAKPQYILTEQGVGYRMVDDM